jgi:hypothetical protein
MKPAIAPTAVVVAMALGLTGQPVRAAPSPAPLVATFVQLCADTGGDTDAALAAADAAGWRTPPKPVAPPPAAVPAAPKPTGRHRLHPAVPAPAIDVPPNVVPPTADLQYRTRPEPTRLSVLSVGTFAASADSRLRSCTISVQAAPGAPPLDLAAVRQSLQDWAGVPPLAGHDAPGMLVFAFIDGQQGHEALPPSFDPLTNHDVKVAGVVVISLISFRDVSMIVYQTDDR